MKKLLALALSVLSVGFVASPAAANVVEPSAKTATTAANAVAPQIRIQLGGNKNRNRRVRTTTTTRITRVGRQQYRETIQTRRLANGRTQTRVISRVRIR